MTSARTDKIATELALILEAASGIDVREYPPEQSFFDLGMDSLILTQASIQIERKLGVKVGFRELLEELSCVKALSAHLAARSSLFADEASSPEAPAQAPLAAVAPPKQPSSLPVEKPATPAPAFEPPTPLPVLEQPAMAGSSDQTLAGLLQLFQTQLAMLERHTAQGPKVAASPSSLPGTPAAAAQAATPAKASVPAPGGAAAVSASEPTAKPFGAIARISKDASAMTERQQSFFKDFLARYQAKTKKSREHTQTYRGTHADPRVVTGFKPHLKELIYPLVMNRSRGAELWDLDGNRYVDLTCGFGSNFFGNMPQWLEDRLIQQIKCGVEIGPQHELAGVVSAKLARYIGHERVAFCNTGSEAVLGAIRIARTVTGREKIVSFSGSYHGIIDEVIVRASKSGKALPAAPGIMPGAVGQTIVLDYGVSASLETIKAHAKDIACVLIESVQSRRPDFRPKEFIEALRKLCDETGIVMVFDEIITGFRKGRAGAQGYYGVKADLATYGKVIGGGISIGVIAGKSKYMDALDGGPWQFGDASLPEVGVTYFAGTFVRHPLALAAMDAVLDFLARSPESLASQLDARADAYVARVNAIFERYQAPWRYVNWGSMMKLNASEEFANLELLVYLLRYRGVHTWDGFPNFLTIAHQDQDIDFIVQAFEDSVRELAEAGFFPSEAAAKAQPLVGRGANGTAMRFARDPNKPGAYIPVHN